jgi:hypothetical protein
LILDTVFNKLLKLKDEISEEWLETVIYKYCFLHKLVQPQTNGNLGIAILRIVDLLKKFRGISNIFELLDYEETKIKKQFEYSKL